MARPFRSIVMGPKKSDCAPTSSYLVDAPVHGWTAYVEREHLDRMRGSKFTQQAGPLLSERALASARGEHARRGQSGRAYAFLPTSELKTAYALLGAEE